MQNFIAFSINASLALPGPFLFCISSFFQESIIRVTPNLKICTYQPKQSVFPFLLFCFQRFFRRQNLRRSQRVFCWNWRWFIWTKSTKIIVYREQYLRRCKNVSSTSSRIKDSMIILPSPGMPGPASPERNGLSWLCWRINDLEFPRFRDFINRFINCSSTHYHPPRHFAPSPPRGSISPSSNFTMFEKF